MAWGMSKDMTPEISRTSADDNLWYKFLQASIKFDGRNNKSEGWSWFWGIYYLSRDIKKFQSLDIKAIQKKVPDEHWVKEIKHEDYIDPKGTPFKNIHDELLKINTFSTLHDSLKLISDREKLTEINFSNLNFRKIAIFSTLIFPIDTKFSNSKFFKNSLFTNVIFLDTADFRDTEFHGETAKFRDTAFKKIANFTDASFEHYANFKGSTFGGRTTFQRAKFKLHAPRFYGAEFNNEITFFGMIPPKIEIDYNDSFNVKGKKVTDDEIGKNHRKRIEENQNSFENTSILLDGTKKYHDQHFFFRQEMRCRRRLESFFNRTTYEAYEVLADYGYGVGHAFFWWCVHICLWANILFFAVFQNIDGDYKRLSCSFLTSLSNAHSFFLSKGERLSSCYDKDKASEKIMVAFDLIWAIETISGALFLFLVLLTLRIRFKL